MARPWLRFHTPLIGRVGDWRAGLGRSLCSLLARSFVCECHTISAVPRFQPPPRRTQHADFPHCALLFASPQGLWGLSCRSGFRRGSNHSVAIEQLQSLVQPSPTPPRPAKALSVPGSQQMAPDLLLHPVFHEAEALAGVSHRKVVHPTAQHRVDQLHDPINRLRDLDRSMTPIRASLGWLSAQGIRKPRHSRPHLRAFGHLFRRRYVDRQLARPRPDALHVEIDANRNPVFRGHIAFGCTSRPGQNVPLARGPCSRSSARHLHSLRRRRCPAMSGLTGHMRRAAMKLT